MVDHTVDSTEETVKQGTVSKEEGTQGVSDGKDAVAVSDVKELKRHGCSSVDGIFIAAGSAEAAFAAERDEFEVTTVGTAVHGATERRVTTVKHPVNVINNSLSWM